MVRPKESVEFSRVAQAVVALDNATSAGDAYHNGRAVVLAGVY
tara:strand:- start:464 stop:592 length:129 start_codon:yes stop_codon:yes gene_type:complete